MTPKPLLSLYLTGEDFTLPRDIPNPHYNVLYSTTKRHLTCLNQTLYAQRRDAVQSSSSNPCIAYHILSSSIRFHCCTSLPFPSLSLTPRPHRLAPPKHIKTNPSNSDVGISSLNTFRPEALAEMQVVVQTMIRRDGTGGGDKWGSGKVE
jgi:hypothetical protein